MCHEPRSGSVVEFVAPSHSSRSRSDAEASSQTRGPKGSWPGRAGHRSWRWPANPRPSCSRGPHPGEGSCLLRLVGLAARSGSLGGARWAAFRSQSVWFADRPFSVNLSRLLGARMYHKTRNSATRENTCPPKQTQKRVFLKTSPKNDELLKLWAGGAPGVP